MIKSIPYETIHRPTTHKTNSLDRIQKNKKKKRNNKYQLIEKYQLGFIKSHYTIKTKCFLSFGLSCYWCEIFIGFIGDYSSPRNIFNADLSVFSMHNAYPKILVKDPS